MSIYVYIWFGPLNEHNTLNGLLGHNVGHASMEIVDKKKPNKKIYISHRPKTDNSFNKLSKIQNILSRLQIDTSKKYIFKDFCEKADSISLKEECELRERKYDKKIKIFGLNEDKIKEFYKDYQNNNLPIEKRSYHINKNNCCTMIVSFLREGLECSKESCIKCTPTNNLSSQGKRIKKGESIGVIIAAFIIFILLILSVLSDLFMPWMSEDALSLISSISSTENLVKLSVFIIMIYISIFRFSVSLEDSLRKSVNSFWCPSTLENFINKINKNKKNKCLN